MSGAWKGSKVCIAIYKAFIWDYPVYEGCHYLDTHTISDLFEKYPPHNHTYDISPDHDADDEDYDSDLTVESNVVFH